MHFNFLNQQKKFSLKNAYLINDKMNKLLERYNKILLKNPITNSNIIIVDFYNVYCYMINFKKYNKFTRETWVSTVNCLINSIPKNKKVFMISKPIFEIDDTDILNITKNCNINYVIVEDLSLIKSTNKERDDYTCIMLHNMFKKDALIITNDNYDNYPNIICNTKAFRLRTYTKGHILNSTMDDALIKKTNTTLKNYKKSLLKTGFYLKPRSFYN